MTCVKFSLLRTTTTNKRPTPLSSSSIYHKLHAWTLPLSTVVVVQEKNSLENEGAGSSLLPVNLVSLYGFSSRFVEYADGLVEEPRVFPDARPRRDLPSSITPASSCDLTVPSVETLSSSLVLSPSSCRFWTMVFILLGGRANFLRLGSRKGFQVSEWVVGICVLSIFLVFFLGIETRTTPPNFGSHGYRTDDNV